MLVLRSAVVIIVALALSMSFAVPAENVPETAYDESEPLPYEMTSLFSIRQQESARVPHLALRLEFPLQFHSRARRKMFAERLERTPRPTGGSVVILDHSLRC
jgi:hypothetical protein